MPQPQPLVVLRSWSDGSPPVVRRIAKDSDHRDSQLVVIPDHNGTFITQEVPAGKEQPDELVKLAPNNNRMVKNKRSASNESSDSQIANMHPHFEQHLQQQQPHLNGNSNGHIPSHRTFSTMSPIPYRNLHLDGNLLRSRSSLSIDSAGSPTSPTTSIPSSPNPNSRYKALGPEFEATVPKRLVFNRSSWIRQDTNRLGRVCDDDDW